MGLNDACESNDGEFYDDPKDIDHDDGVKKEDACLVSYKSYPLSSCRFPRLSTR